MAPMRWWMRNCPSSCWRLATSTIRTRVLRYRRTLEVMKEVRSRRGPLVTVATEGDKEVAKIADQVFYVPRLRSCCCRLSK